VRAERAAGHASAVKRTKRSASISGKSRSGRGSWAQILRTYAGSDPVSPTVTWPWRRQIRALPARTTLPHTDARRARNRPSWYAGGTVIALLRFWFDLVLAFVAPRAALVVENLILRQQLIVIRRQIKRPRLRRFDRWLIGALASRFHRLMDVVLLVKPETVIGWHRAAWRLLWRWRSHRPPGRPPVDADLRELIRRMWRENPTWGQQIIAAELAKLGYQISPRTVAKYRPSNLDRQRGQRWTTFIRNQLNETWACDFFVLGTARWAAQRIAEVTSRSRDSWSTTETRSMEPTSTAVSADSAPDSSPLRLARPRPIPSPSA